METRKTVACVTLLIAALVVVKPAPAIAGQDERAQARFDEDQTRERAEREIADQARERADQDRERADRERERADRDRERAQQARERVETSYERAQDAIEREQWTQAIERFGAIVAANAPRADAALYWRAYAFDKLNRQADALTAVAQLLKTYPTSRWLNEAKALEIQVRQRAGQPVSPDQQNDEDLKLLAIQGLSQSDPEQAVPLLEKFLQGNQSPRLKERALFVLAQSGSARARQVITGVARGNSNPDLQQKAIQYLGMNGTPANRQILGEIYESTNDIDIKRRILRAFMMSGDRQRVLAAATGEKSTELRVEAVRQLGMMGARDELWQLYQKEQSVDVRQQMLQGMMMSGDATHLIEVANSDSNMDLRRQAIRQLGMVGASRAGEALVTIYTRQTDPGIKSAAIEALFIQGNAEALVGLARKETDRDMKRRIVEKLSIMRSPAATNYLLELLK
jgi:HEAT repeat protein